MERSREKHQATMVQSRVGVGGVFVSILSGFFVGFSHRHFTAPLVNKRQYGVNKYFVQAWGTGQGAACREESKAKLTRTGFGR